MRTVCEMLTTDSERSVAVDAGSNISFSCRSEHHYSNSHVHWSYMETDTNTKPVIIHDGKRLHPKYASRHNVRYDPTSRESTLTINHAKANDEGVYMCMESVSATDGIDFRLRVVG